MDRMIAVDEVSQRASFNIATVSAGKSATPPLSPPARTWIVDRTLYSIDGQARLATTTIRRISRQRCSLVIPHRAKTTFPFRALLFRQVIYFRRNEPNSKRCSNVGKLGFRNGKAST